MIGWLSGMRQKLVERQAHRWVMRMLDDPARYAARLEEWLSRSSEHRAVYKRVAIEVGYASDAAKQMPALRAAVHEDATRPASFWARYRLLPVGLAVAMAFLAVFGWHVITSQWHSEVDERKTSQLFAIDRGSRTIRLDDGSIVTLSGASNVNVRYTAGERAIDLGQGHARFSVEHDPSRPFVVYVRGGKVTAVGTVFEIEAGDRVIVRLLTGRVIVTKPSPLLPSGVPQVTLTKGQEVAFNASDQTNAPASANDVSRDIRTFDDVTVSKILQEVNGRSSTKIVLSDPAIGERKVFADLNVNDPEGVAKKLAVILDLKMERLTPRQIRLSFNR